MSYGLITCVESPVHALYMITSLLHATLLDDINLIVAMVVISGDYDR